jgi:hypothetical protein
MSTTKFSNPTQYGTRKIQIDGEDIIGLFYSLEIFENIYSPIITGTISIFDTDGAGFIEKEEIEFIEDIEFEFINANEEILEFKGKLNGLKNETVKGHKKIYAIDFTSETMRKNETTFVTKKYSNQKPGEIVEEMVEKLGGEIDKKDNDGQPMSFVSGRRRPCDVIGYVLTHGVTQESKVSDKEKSQSEKAEGTTGYLFWETLDGFRFGSVDGVNKGELGERHEDFKTQLQNKNLTMEETMNGIIDYEFKEIGDYQSKLRSGAFKSNVITFDMDKGLYKEHTYEPVVDFTATKKQLEAMGDFPTRTMWKPISNERFELNCSAADPNTHDQSKKYLAQNNVRQNTFNDQTGSIVLPPQYKIRSGDTIDIKISKVKSTTDTEGGYDKKHSGRYLIKQVGHHITSDGRAYTKISTCRTTVQQNDNTSEKS